MIAGVARGVGGIPVAILLGAALWTAIIAASYLLYRALT